MMSSVANFALSLVAKEFRKSLVVVIVRLRTKVYFLKLTVDFWNFIAFLLLS